MPPILFTPPLGVIFLSLKDPTHHLCSPRTVGAAHACTHAHTRTRFCPPRRRIHSSHSTSVSHPSSAGWSPQMPPPLPRVPQFYGNICSRKNPRCFFWSLSLWLLPFYFISPTLQPLYDFLMISWFLSDSTVSPSLYQIRMYKRIYILLFKICL